MSLRGLSQRERPAPAGPIAFYRLDSMTAEEPTGAVEGPGSGSRRASAARSRAEERLMRQRGALRPLGWAVILVVCVGAFGGHPGPGPRGDGLAVALALCVFGGALAVTIRDPFTRLGIGRQAVVVAAMGAAGVALTGLQPRGATGLAGGAAIWMAVIRLPVRPGVGLAACLTVALAITVGISGSSSEAVLAATLLCALLGLIAYFMRRAREGQDRTELLLAELEDAREDQLRAAAFAERGRIASELHDVLAHSLSGAAIQLQGARMVADRDRAGSQLSGAIDRASELVKDGLANARQAVGALRGEELPGVGALESLVASFRADLNLEVTLRIEGGTRTLPAEAGLALYRGAQEALTNVGRYAPGASTSVLVRYEADRTVLLIEDRLPGPASAGDGGEGLTGVGGGRGLTGMRERVERVGGTMEAGPTAEGWRVELGVPA